MSDVTTEIARSLYVSASQVSAARLAVERGRPLPNVSARALSALANPAPVGTPSLSSISEQPIRGTLGDDPSEPHAQEEGTERASVDHLAPNELITGWGTVLEGAAFVSQRLSEGLERAGVSAPFFDVLVRLAREPSQRLAITKLAAEVSLTTGGFAVLLDRMEREGLVYRQHSAQDRRVIWAVLTDAGRAAAASIFPAHVSHLRDEIEDVIGSEGARTLIDLMSKLRDHALRKKTSGLD